MGSPKIFGVAPARTYCHRGVMTAVPNETELGLIRCTFILMRSLHIYGIRLPETAACASLTCWLGEVRAFAFTSIRFKPRKIGRASCRERVEIEVGVRG